MLSWRKRVIPVLLLKGQGLVKTEKFKNPLYVGDAINAVKIFNEKEVDELSLIDITPLSERDTPNFEAIRDIASECFIPLSYGGKVRSIEGIKRVLGQGVEKVIINTAAIENPSFLKEACEFFGSSTIVASIDVKKDFFGRQFVYSRYGSKNTKMKPLEVVKQVTDCGVGEIFLNSIDRDGTRSGYDLDLIKTCSNAVEVPLIACGGADKTDDFVSAFSNGASAVAAGAKFVFKGSHKAVLITYLTAQEQEILAKYEQQ